MYKVYLLIGKIFSHFHIVWALKFINLICSIFERKNSILPSEQDAESLLDRMHNDVHSSAICMHRVEKEACDLQIIVPAYNVDSYIDHCIQSVLSQKTKYSYELIIINDGSTDCTGKIIAKYEDYKCVTIITQENRGFSGARNRALRAIRSKYIMFLDSDDALAPGAIDYLMDMAYTYHADIVQGGYNRIVGDQIKKGYICNTAISVDAAKINGFPWGKVYKAELFYHVQFPEKYWFEDSIIKLLVVPNASSMCTINKSVYFYRDNPKGITHTSIGNPKVIDTFYITRSILQDAQRLGMVQRYKEYYINQVIRQIRINALRTFVLGDVASKSIFVLTKCLIESLFESSDYEMLSKKKMLNSILNNDYAQYRRLCCLGICS